MDRTILVTLSLACIHHPMGWAAATPRKPGSRSFKLHEFRHSCVSNLLMSGISPRLVSRWVGDTESMVLSTYSHLLPSEKQDMAELMNKIVVDG